MAQFLDEQGLITLKGQTDKLYAGKGELANKQDKLTAGANISIVGNEISATVSQGPEGTSIKLAERTENLYFDLATWQGWASDGREIQFNYIINANDFKPNDVFVFSGYISDLDNTPVTLIGTVIKVNTATQVEVKNMKLIYGTPGPAGADSTVPGPANTLKIGTVTKGESASATITGTAPNQTLNLVLPKGDKGQDGTDIKVNGVTQTSIAFTSDPQTQINGKITGTSKNITKVSHCDWNGSTTSATQFPTINTLAFWNGAYNNNNQSNLKYCAGGKIIANTTDLAAKQDKLISGTNIKTINNQSLLGSGNITIESGGGKSELLWEDWSNPLSSTYNERPIKATFKNYDYFRITLSEKTTSSNISIEVIILKNDIKKDLASGQLVSYMALPPYFTGSAIECNSRMLFGIKQSGLAKLNTVQLFNKAHYIVYRIEGVEL